MKKRFQSAKSLFPSIQCNKRIISFLSMLLFCIQLMAGEVSISDITKVARNCYAEKLKLDPGTIEVGNILTLEKEGIPLIRAINFKNGGYVLVAADDVSLPVIGYSESGTFQEGDHAPAFQNQLDYYKEQIYQAIVQDATPLESAKDKWDSYISGNKTKVAGETLSVLPLLTTTWGQQKYYNASCPSDPAGPDGHVRVGCVAVAMGQVMNYWSHPWYGEGSHGYTHDDYGYLSADFENTLNNYDSIPDVLTDYNSYVSTLLFHCGVSVEMNYGPDGSGAWGWLYPYYNAVPDALKDYFYFHDGTDCKLRSSYVFDWHDFLKNDLDLGRPVIYGGADLWDPSVAHAWVVDGYNGDLYHMNWGWSGNDDEYYTLDNLVPENVLPNNLNDYHHAVFGARPKTGNIGGTITLAESPYTVHYPLQVPSGMLLSIEPGVEMVFKGRYPLHVVGQIEAIGTLSDTIVFKAEDPVVGWGGIRLNGIIGPDSSRFKFCSFTNGFAYHKLTYFLGSFGFTGRNHGGAIYCSNAPAVSLINCLFACNYADAEGGAIYCEEASDILIRNSVIQQNKAETQGGGISITNSDLLITGSRISQNQNQTSGGGIWLANSSLTLINDSIVGNKSKFGGGIACRESNLTMTNVVIREDTALVDAGGILCEFNSSVEMNEVEIYANRSAKGGGGVLVSSSSMDMYNSKVAFNSSSEMHGGGILCGLSGEVDIKNSLIYGNSADSAGGVFIAGNTAFTIENVTISNNSGSVNSDELTIQDGHFNARNSIIWHAYGDPPRVTGTSFLTCTYSDIKGGAEESWFGTGCIDLDPQFSNPYYNGFDLLWPDYPEPETRSPCIDAGDPVSPVDPDGTTADMGAIPYEQVFTPLSGGNISGTLYCSESPYYVLGDLTVPAGDELIIEPCVYLVFRGDYKLNVAGRLLAEGTASQKIGFMPSDTLTGWQGIRFINTNANGQDSSKLACCRIRYGNADGYNENGQGGGVYANQSSKLLLSDCHFYRNRAKTNGGAAYFTSGSSALIRRTVFMENSSSFGGALGFYSSANAIIRDCLMMNNRGEYGGAISAVACAPVLEGTSILRNRAAKFGGGLYRSGGQVPVFDETNRCSVYDNYADLAGHDFFTNPDVYVPPVTNVYLDTGSVAVYQDHFTYPGYLFDMDVENPFFSQVDANLYVSPTGSDDNDGTSPAEPLRTMKRALARILASSGNQRTVFLADGTYSKTETGELFPVNLRNHVTIRGESRVGTSIDGEDLYQLMTSYGDQYDSVTVLTLQHAYRDGDGGAVCIENYSNPYFHDVSFRNNYSETNGGAVWCYDHSSPVFSDVRFQENESNASGGALWTQKNDMVVLDNVQLVSNVSRNTGGAIQAGYDDYFWLRNANFSNNEVTNGDGGGARFNNGPFRLDDVVFYGNHSSHDGGGLFAYSAELQLKNSFFSSNEADNTGGGLYFYHSVDADMENVEFHNNSSDAGGAIWGFYGSALKINNGLFDNNSTVSDPYNTGEGGALCLKDVETQLINVTFADNTSDGDGGGLYFWNNACTVSNSIFWGNSGAQIYPDDEATVDVQYSDIEGGWPSGTGNIDADPLFVSTGFADYKLSSGSPCIDGGNPDTTGMNLPIFDLGGDPRISNGTIDMGAYEYFSGFELDLKVFLQGPYSGTSMQTGLMNGSLLPLVQPFDAEPWSYPGTEEVSVFPETSIVDWLLIEVRDAPNVASATPETVLGRQAVFLLSDGKVVDINGNIPRFGSAPVNQCFPVILHRNHLGIISAYPLTETDGVYTYDFSSPPGQAFGTAPQINFGDGLYGLHGGDGNTDGLIGETDKTAVWETQAGTSGYIQGDFNLDGQVDNRDKNDVWTGNAGQASQVPE